MIKRKDAGLPAARPEGKLRLGFPVKVRKTGKTKTVNVAPVWTGHADYVHPFEFMGFMRGVADRDFDVMIEAKAKDLALIRLSPTCCATRPKWRCGSVSTSAKKPGSTPRKRP
jgi:hypothetical protein